MSEEPLTIFGHPVVMADVGLPEIDIEFGPPMEWAPMKDYQYMRIVPYPERTADCQCEQHLEEVIDGTLFSGFTPRFRCAVCQMTILEAAS